MKSPPQSPDDQDSGKSNGKKINSSPDGEADLSGRLDDLGSRIQKKQKENEKHLERDTSSKSQGVAQALRLSSEFVAGIAVGAGFGYAIDTVAGTSPWGMIVFLFLGFGAGVLNAMRSAGLIAKSNLHIRADIDKKRDN